MQKYITKLAGPFEGPIQSKRPQKSYTNRPAACYGPVWPFRARPVAAVLRADSKLVAVAAGPFRTGAFRITSYGSTARYEIVRIWYAKFRKRLRGLRVKAVKIDNFRIELGIVLNNTVIR